MGDTIALLLSPFKALDYDPHDCCKILLDKWHKNGWLVQDDPLYYHFIARSRFLACVIYGVSLDPKRKTGENYSGVKKAFNEIINRIELRLVTSLDFVYTSLTN